MSVGEILERDENRPAYVRFERRAVTDSQKTLSEGHHVAKDEDYALITPPYSKDVVEKKVAAWFVSVEKNVRAGRIPQKHLDLWKESYRRWQDGQEPPVDGTPIKDWSSISPAQCKNLLNAGCRSVEDLAQANDEAMRRLGMGANDLKNKARAWLQAAKDHGPLTMQIASLEKQNEQLKGTIESLQDQIKRFEIRMDAQDGEVSKEDEYKGYEGYDNLNITKDDIMPGTTPQEIEERHAETMRKAESGVWSPKEPSELVVQEKSPAERYLEKFGKKPHHLMKEATILKKLQE